MGPVTFYILLKWAAYILWCFVGLRRLHPARPRPLLMAAAFGTLRLAMGWGLGVAIWMLIAYVYSALDAVPGRSLLTYLAVYVPVRWIEWSIMALVLAPAPATRSAVLLGADSRARGWVAGGIVISCVADLPLIWAAGGLPLGRFMC